MGRLADPRVHHDRAVIGIGIEAKHRELEPVLPLRLAVAARALQPNLERMGTMSFSKLSRRSSAFAPLPAARIRPNRPAAAAAPKARQETIIGIRRGVGRREESIHKPIHQQMLMAGRAQGKRNQAPTAKGSAGNPPPLTPSTSPLARSARPVRQVGRRGGADAGFGRAVGLLAGADALDPVGQVQQLAVGLVVEVGPARAVAEDQLAGLELALAARDGSRSGRGRGRASPRSP